MPIALGIRDWFIPDSRNLKRQKIIFSVPLKYLLKQGDEYAVTQYMIEYAGILQHKGEIKKAIACATKSFGNAAKNSIIEFERDAAYRLAQLYQVSGKYDSAYHYQSLYINANDSIKSV